MSGIRAKNNLVMYCGSKGFTGVMIVYDFGICIDIQNRGEGNVKVMLLQASVYIAVDMLPIPGAQGITEQMYLAVFQIVFHSEYLMPSLYMTRGIGFYFLLVCSIVVVLGNRMVRKRRG